MQWIWKIGDWGEQSDNNDNNNTFLPHDASAERGDATVSRPSVCTSVRNDQVPCSNTLEFFENNFTAE